MDTWVGWLVTVWWVWLSDWSSYRISLLSPLLSFQSGVGFSVTWTHSPPLHHSTNMIQVYTDLTSDYTLYFGVIKHWNMTKYFKHKWIFGTLYNNLRTDIHILHVRLGRTGTIWWYFLLCQLVLTSLTVSITLAQVNQEIYSEQDLLAIDSETHNTVVIAPPPANFHSSNSVEGKSRLIKEGRNLKI